MPEPFIFGAIYSGALMILCVECWFSDDPWLFNHSPLFLFRAPGEVTKADVPMGRYTRVFSAWHAGGVCFCFFTTIIAMDFPPEAKKEIALTLGLLWLIWATTNTWRALFNSDSFFRPGAAMHSLIGGCGIAAYWHLGYWYTNTTALKTGEIIVLTVFSIIAIGLVFRTARPNKALAESR